MPIIQWNAALCPGIPEIDQHHKRLVLLVNDAYDEFREGRALSPSLLDELVTCCSEHFWYEESLMAEACYHKLAAHQAEHELFSCRLTGLRNGFKGDISHSIELLWFLCNWVTHHLRETDADFGHFLAGRGEGAKRRRNCRKTVLQ